MHVEGKALMLLDWQWGHRREANIMEESKTQGGDEKGMERIAKGVAGFFTNETWNTQMEEETLFQVERERYLFLQLLNRQRSVQMNVLGNFDRIVKWFQVFLTACDKHHDVKSAKTAMVLSETFYKVVNEQKVFLQQRIRDHVIWKNVQVFMYFFCILLKL